ncbi:hypothetical protein INT47_001390 [Mucor saturninus]|uniref:Retrotransposon gag domain-containing protein n=1 Tax=Mucor saturninus TaxID=64648 RepID=A0A8H7UMX0_9FUNG|nr:hypothetical protein INT47_001390 [Mucor saturninus]
MYQESAATPAPIEDSSDMNIQGQEPSPMDFSKDALQIQEDQATSSPTGLSGLSGLSGPDDTKTQKGNVGHITKNIKQDVKNPSPHQLIRKINHVSILDSPTSDELDEDAKLIKLYQNQIKELHKALLMCDDLDTLTKNNQLIAQLNLSIKKLKPEIKKQPEMENATPNRNNFKEIDIPNFELIDDPASNKSVHYPSQNASWDEAKENLNDRFGNSANKANNLEKYLGLRQLKNENIRDYVDRYLDTYRRLPYANSGSNSLDAMKFLKSLLPKAKEEVSTLLKKNQKVDTESYLPDNLEDLFKYLEKYIGDIQEAFYISVIVPNNNKTTMNDSETTTAKSHRNIEGFDNNQKKEIFKITTTVVFDKNVTIKK